VAAADAPLREAAVKKKSSTFSTSTSVPGIELNIELNIEATPEYRQGWLAWFDTKAQNPYGSHVDTDACPYLLGTGTNDRRTRWLDGWWSAWLNDWIERFDARFAQQCMKT
jgi:hypothetical protein